MIDRLEHTGYARRDRDPGDRRKVIVSLVPEKVAEIYEHYREHGEHVARILSSRDSTELGVIQRFLAELTTEPGTG